MINTQKLQNRQTLSLKKLRPTPQKSQHRWCAVGFLKILKLHITEQNNNAPLREGWNMNEKKSNISVTLGAQSAFERGGQAVPLGGRYLLVCVSDDGVEDRLGPGPFGATHPSDALRPPFLRPIDEFPLGFLPPPVMCKNTVVFALPLKSAVPRMS